MRWAVLPLLLAAASAARAADADCPYDGYLMLDRPQDRLQACATLLEHTDDAVGRSKILVYRSYLKSGLGDGAGALADAEDAIKLTPGRAEPYTRRGALLDQVRHDVAGAIDSYDEALKRDPSNDLALRYRADAEVKTGAYDKATDDFTRLIERSTNYNNYIARGDLWRLRGRYPDAIADYERALKDGAQSVLGLGPTRATFALGPTLAVAAGQSAPVATEFARPPVASRSEVEIWRKGGEPSFCALSSSGFDQPAQAFARGADRYALTLSDETWRFAPASTYQVTLVRNGVEQPATATAIGEHVIGMSWAAASPLAAALQKPGSTYDFTVRTAAQTISFKVFGEFQRLDECWKTQQASSNPFGAAGQAGRSNPFEPAPPKP